MDKSRMLCMILVFLCQFWTGGAVHLRQDQNYAHKYGNTPIYNQYTYQQSLEEKQSQFSSQLRNIKDKFTKMNLMLRNSNISDSQEVILLQQTLAEERDALYNTQNYLNVPFALRSCSCINLTDEMKQSIATQIEKLAVNINQLKKQIKKQYDNPYCDQGKCQSVIEAKKQAEKMSKYLEIMKDTITAKCCQIVHYLYRDNLLTSKPWYYGSTNQTEYRKMLFIKSQSYNLTLCPQYKPFSSQDMKSCYMCPQNKVLFNLGSRVCEQDCPNRLQILDTDRHICDYDRTCSQGQNFNDFTLQCQKIPEHLNESHCPSDKPYWNSKQYYCSLCQASKPFFDTLTKKCRTCYGNQIWNKKMQKCQRQHNKCPSDKPFLNPKTQQCEQCLQSFKYHSETQSCEKQCPAGQKYSRQQKKCILNELGQTGTEGRCPPQLPIWDPIMLECGLCYSKRPVWNIEKQECQPCASDTKWNPNKMLCLKSCKEGYHFNEQKNQCLQNQCPPFEPVWNSQTQVCQKCAIGLHYNSAVRLCKNSSLSGYVSVCIEPAPYWNSDRLKCEECQEGTSYNLTTKQCKEISEPKHSKQHFKLLTHHHHEQLIDDNKYKKHHKILI